MGLAASQARILLLTSKNDSLELQAQLISNERLLLAQEQEDIANEYSDSTSNSIYTCTIYSEDANTKTGTATKPLSLEALAQSAYDGSAHRVYVKYGDDYVGAESTYDTSTGKWSTKYYDKDGKELDASNSQVKALNNHGAYSLMQMSARNNTLEVYTEAPSDLDPNDNTAVDIGDGRFIRKSLESLTNVSSRYYTEDDASSQAEYQAAMARINRLDTQLENKLNQVETQKKSVETEMDSVKQITKSNSERTFKYFG